MTVVTPEQIAGRLRPLNLEGPGIDLFPRTLHPMLAEMVKKPFDDPAWIYEVKWDGFRLLAFVHDGKVDLRSRNLHFLH